MSAASFLLHGCTVRLAGDPAAVAGLAADLAAFPPGGQTCDVEVTAVLSRPARSTAPALFSARRWTVIASPPGTRVVWYPEGALCELDYRSGRCRVTAGDPALLRELCFLLAVSRAGEWLDRRALHRLHAGALQADGRALLFCGAQGAGKTTLLLELLKDPAFALLSDDTPLISPAGEVFPFPLRVGLGEDSPHLARFSGAETFKRRHYPPKRLVPAAGAGRLAAGPCRPSAVFQVRKGGAPGLTRCSRAAAAAELAVSLVAGAGVPQMAEYFLRPSAADAAAKARILASRLGAAFSLFRKASFWTFTAGPRPAENADAFRDFLRSGSARASAR